MHALQGLLELSLPFFLLVGLGWAAAQQGWVPTSALSGLNAFVLYLALPAMLVRLGRQWALSGFVGAAVLPLYALASVLLGLLAWGLLRQHAAGPRGMAVLVTLFPNSGFLGVPLLTALIGAQAAAPLVALIVFDLAVTTTVCLSLAGAPGNFVQRVLRNPLPWAVATGLLLGLWGGELPAPLGRTLNLLADGVTASALVALGVALATVRDAPAVPGARGLMLLKLVGHPLLALGLGAVAWWAGVLHTAQLQLLVLACALPGAANVAMLAERLGLGDALVPRSIFWTTLLAPLTLPVVALALGVQG